MSVEFYDVLNTHQKGESATYPQAALARRLALLLLIAGNDHAASSRLARHHASTPCGHVQLRFLGSSASLLSDLVFTEGVYPEKRSSLPQRRKDRQGPQRKSKASRCFCLSRPLTCRGSRKTMPSHCFLCDLCAFAVRFSGSSASAVSFFTHPAFGTLRQGLPWKPLRSGSMPQRSCLNPLAAFRPAAPSSRCRAGSARR